MGRLRRPVESRLLDGTYQRSRHGPLPDSEDTSLTPPSRPADLTGTARKYWDELLSLLSNVARERDGPMLADLCRWRAELTRVRSVLKRTRPGGKGYNQLLIAAGICSDKMDKIASRFGLTPSDRAKLRAEQVGPVKSKVATRKPTKLDRNGAPK